MDENAETETDALDPVIREAREVAEEVRRIVDAARTARVEVSHVLALLDEGIDLVRAVAILVETNAAKGGRSILDTVRAVVRRRRPRKAVK